MAACVRHTLTWVACWLALIGLAHAQGLQIMPVTLSLPPGQMSSTVFLTNKSTDSQTIQVRPFKWDQTAGSDDLSATRLLAVSPPITEIPPGETQVFRIILRQPAGAREATYRLLFDELPQPAPAGGIRVALRLSVPVFAGANARPESALVWSISLDGGTARLTATNQGTRHIRILKAVLTHVAAQGQPDQAPFSISFAGMGYILAGASRSWPIEGGARLQPGSIMHLAAPSDQGPVDAMVHVPPP